MTATARPQAAFAYCRESGTDEANQPCRIFPPEMCAESILSRGCQFFESLATMHCSNVRAP
jgi:hypothetical protein